MTASSSELSVNIIIFYIMWVYIRQDNNLSQEIIVLGASYLSTEFIFG